MNYMMQSRLCIIAVVLLALMLLYGCTYEACFGICAIPCTPFIIIPPMFWTCGTSCAKFCDLHFGSLQNCSEHTDECTATFERIQLTAIEICEEHPDECQQAFDAWVESLDEEPEE